MKTINSFIAAVALGLGTVIFAGNANAFFDVVPMNVTEKALVKLVVPKNHQTYVYITSPAGDILHEETMSNYNPSMRVFDLSNLEDGIYTFHSSSDQVDVTKKVMVDDASVKILSKDVEYKPVFSIQDDKLSINYLNLGQEEIELSIDNALYDFLSSTEGNPLSFNKVLDISQMFNGEYRAEIKVGDKVYAHYFRVQ